MTHRASRALGNPIAKPPAEARDAPLGTDLNPRLVAAATWLSPATGAAAIGIGSLVLVGWTFDLPRLTSLGPGWATMKANTASTFVLAGVSLILLRREDPTPWERGGAMVGAGVVALVGLLTLLESLGGWDCGLDQLLVRGPASLATGPAPGRMAPATALNGLLIGVSLLSLAADPRGRWPAGAWAALAVAVISLLALLGYAYDLQTLALVGPYASVAVHTAMTFFLLAVGILVARPHGGLLVPVFSESAGGVMFRRLVPWVLGVPLGLGWVSDQGAVAGWYPAAFRVPLIVLSSVLVFLVVVIANARLLHHTDLGRRRAQAELRTAHTALEQRLREQATQLAVTRLFAEAAPLEDTRPALLQAMAEGLGWDVSEWWSLDEAAGALRRAGSWHSPGLDVTAFEAASRELMLAPGVGLVGTVWVTAEATWQRDVVADPAFVRAAAAAMAGLHTALAVPIGHGPARQHGVLLLYSRQIRAIDPALLGMTADLGRRIGQYLDHQQAEAALRHRDEQIRQLQRLEAVGRLAGGVAHDFNNLLTVILGRVELLRTRAPLDERLQHDLGLIQTTAERAARLTQQLLAFSRKQILQPIVVDLNATLAEMTTLLRRLIGEDIDFVFRPGSELGRVQADPGQLEQVLVNLVVNARDAMPDGGRLTVETGNIELSDHYAQQHVGARPGPYVMLAVSDTGLGMDAETLARIFEPFFTTKEPGKGTGLGLSTVYGIVKQSGGNIWAYSEPGHGTTFKIYLPRVEAAATAEPVLLPVPGRGTETILLVEDEVAVRDMVREILERYGYTVFGARDVADARLIAERHLGVIHLVLTDVVMPQLSGRQLVELLTPLRPEMKVLYMSGYTDNAIVHHGTLDPGTAFIQKPFTPETLARKVRAVLDAPE